MSFTSTKPLLILYFTSTYPLLFILNHDGFSPILSTILHQYYNEQGYNWL